MNIGFQVSIYGGSPSCVVVNAQDFDIIVRDLELQSNVVEVLYRFNTLGKAYEPSSTPSYGLKSTILSL